MSNENENVPNRLAQYLGRGDLGHVTPELVPFAETPDGYADVHDPTHRLIRTAGTGAD